MNPRSPAQVDLIPWERQPGETVKAWEAFVIYRDLGTARTVAKTAHILGKTTATLNPWSQKFRWVDRAAAYDNHCDQRRRQITEESWRVANDAHRALTARVREGLHAKLYGDPAQKVTPLNPDDLDWGDVARLMREVITVERLVHGQPTDFAARVLQVDVNHALDHVRTLVEIARRHMTEEQFRAFVLEYRAATAVGVVEEREPREIGRPS